MVTLFRRARGTGAASASRQDPYEEPPQTITRWDDPRDYEEFTVISHPSRASTTATNASEQAPSSTGDAGPECNQDSEGDDHNNADQPSSRRTSNSLSSSLPNLSPARSSNRPLPLTPSPPAPPPSLLTLPAELIPHLASHLSYPDLLALRHTHPRFLATSLLASSKPLKIAWLLERGEQALPIPRQRALRLDSDAAFTRNPEVAAIMLARRRHAECLAGPGGCRVVLGASCGGRRIAWQSEPLLLLPLIPDGPTVSSSSSSAVKATTTTTATAAKPRHTSEYRIVRYAGEPWPDVAMRTLHDALVGLLWVLRRVAVGTPATADHQVWVNAWAGRYGIADLPRAAPWLARRFVATTADMFACASRRAGLVGAALVGLAVGVALMGGLWAGGLLVAVAWLGGYAVLVSCGLR